MRFNKKNLAIFSFLLIPLLALNVEAGTITATCPQVDVCGIPYECGASDGTCPEDWGATRPDCSNIGNCCDPDASTSGAKVGCGICCNLNDCDTCTNVNNADNANIINNIDTVAVAASIGTASPIDLTGDGIANECDLECVSQYSGQPDTVDPNCGCREDWTCPDWGVCIGNEKTRTCTDSTGCTREETTTCDGYSCDNFKTGSCVPTTGGSLQTGANTVNVQVWQTQYGNNAACSSTCTCPAGTQSMAFTYAVDIEPYDINTGNGDKIEIGSNLLSGETSGTYTATASSMNLRFTSDAIGSYSGGQENYVGAEITGINCIACVPDWQEVSCGTCYPDSSFPSGGSKTCTLTDPTGCGGADRTEQRDCNPNTGSCTNFVCPTLSAGFNTVNINVWQTNYGNHLNNGPKGVGQCQALCICPAGTTYTAFTYETSLDTTGDSLTLDGITTLSGIGTTTVYGGTHGLALTSDERGSYLDGGRDVGLWNGARLTQINCIQPPPGPGVGGEGPPTPPGEGIDVEIGEPEEVIVGVELT